MDTAGSGIGKAAAELMQEMQQAQQEIQNKQATSGGPSGASFGQEMQAQQAGNVQGVQPTTAVTQVTEAKKILAQLKIDATSGTTRVGSANKAKSSQLQELMNDLADGQQKMSKIMKMALSGRKFNPQELLALQAGVYRFSQELELTSKVVEKATSGIKQTMNTQV